MIPDNDEADSEVAEHPGQEENHIEERHRHHNLKHIFLIKKLCDFFILINEIYCKLQREASSAPQPKAYFSYKKMCDFLF